MTSINSLNIVPFIFGLFVSVNSVNILMTEVFEVIIDPPMFNWTFEGDAEQYIYQPSLLNKPDLPSWINYVYSDRLHTGYLFGVPPLDISRDISIEIVALNRKNYETRRNIIPIVITEKLNPAKNEVQMKIDNLNVEDMFDVDRMDRLKDIFRKKLWKDSQEDLYVTYLASAVKWGARLPLDPSEGEGVVIRIGSTVPLSQELIELQEEVRPLWKVPTCPRGFKRTTVERYFRDAGFALDWCTFRLLEHSPSARHREEGNVEKLSNFAESTNLWSSIKKEDVPERSYTYELLFATFVPMMFMAMMAALLSLILCFHHSDFEDEESQVFFDKLFVKCPKRRPSCSSSDHSEVQPNVSSNKYVLNSSSSSEKSVHQQDYSTIHANEDSLKKLMYNKDYSYYQTDSMGTSRSHTGSPTLINRGVHCRPSPPPYIKPMFKAEI